MKYFGFQIQYKKEYISFAGDSELSAIACDLNGFRLLICSDDINVNETTEASCTFRIVDKISLPWVKIFRMTDHTLCFNPETGAFEVQILARKLTDGVLPMESRISCWRLAVLGGVLKEILRGRPICLMHGALLTSPKGNLLLTGQSGIGKSTTSRRWHKVGGTAIADDMSLLEFREDGIWAHPLPTWSRCQMDGVQGLHYPFNPALHVDNLMILGRDPEKEQIKEVSSWEFYQSVYSAALLFYCIILKNMPEATCREIIGMLRKRVDELCGRYPHRALLAHLSGDIRETLKEYL